VRLAVDFAGADHVLAASDYPHQIGSISKMKSSLASVNVSEAERKKIRGENARRLYKL
jgi:predicted TIM-barrel fold metal-dependent hydrolase